MRQPERLTIRWLVPAVGDNRFQEHPLGTALISQQVAARLFAGSRNSDLQTLKNCPLVF